MMFMGEGCDRVWCVQRAVDFACVMNERASDEVALCVGGRCYLWPPKRPEKLPRRTSSSTVQQLKPPLSQMNLSSIGSTACKILLTRKVNMFTVCKFANRIANCKFQTPYLPKHLLVYVSRCDQFACVYCCVHVFAWTLMRLFPPLMFQLINFRKLMQC